MTINFQEFLLRKRTVSDNLLQVDHMSLGEVVHPVLLESIVSTTMI